MNTPDRTLADIHATQYRGAPLGQPAEGTAAPTDAPVTLVRIKLDRSGYAADGTYWGLGIPLYQATAPGYRRTVRAKTKAHAAKILNLPKPVKST